MNACPPAGGVPRLDSDGEKKPLPHAAAKSDCAPVMARSDPMAAVSLPDRRACCSPGTATAAMTPMMATTIRSSMRVKPRLLRMVVLPFLPSTMPLRPLDCQDRRLAGQARRAPQGGSGEAAGRQARPASRFWRMLCRTP